MKLFIFMAVVSLTSCALINKRAERNPQGLIQKALRQLVKAGDAEAPRKGEDTRRKPKLALKAEDLENKDFRGKNLKGLDFGDMDLADADLRDVKLQGAYLKNVRNIEKANLEGAYWDYDTIFPDHLQFHPDKSIDEKTAVRDFLLDKKMILDLRGKDLRDITKAEERKIPEIAILRIHDNIRIDFENADLRGLDINAFDIKNAINLRKANLEGAFYHPNQVFPEGFDPKEHGMIMRD